jgi:hypothetical protein
MNASSYGVSEKEPTLVALTATALFSNRHDNNAQNMN